MAEKECIKCIHNAVCKTAESCDGYVSGCEHFKEQKKGRWQREAVPIANMDIVRYRDTCSICGAKADFLCRDSHYNYCHKCGADMKGE